MFNRILVPLDGSPQAEEILPRVEALAHTHNSRVYLLRVVEPETSAVGAQTVGSEVAIADRGRLETEAKQYLMHHGNVLRAVKVDARVLVTQGGVVESIAQMVDSEQIDVIAMVSRGRSRFGNMMYGNVTNELLNRVDIPLLVIRPTR